MHNSGDAHEHDRGSEKQFFEIRRFFGSRARAEYWWFTLFNMIAGFVVPFALLIAFAPTTIEGEQLLANLYSLAVLLPSLAVGARRLHDTGRSGWWMLLLLTVIGAILLLVWFVMKGETGPNRYGPDPLEGEGYLRAA
ncbi:DUF805 domain-containing protein [Paracoccus sp. Z118]|uniref:DUF805 domain-containing protein n=1 Tax=Paracoccus sp. Z118 TaxID=2851017 RepID=UPI0020B8C2B2|nr:DUF805 domain-containing protein [Paracoccus sp. Z118]